MCNSQKTNMEKQDSSYLRKIKKPLIEKRRRERMNRSLGQLKDILIESNKENTSQLAKLDKAEILEMTLTHIQMLHQQRSVAMAAEASRGYQRGFKDCARHTVDYLTSTSSVGDNELSQLNTHLYNTFNDISSKGSTKSSSVLKPTVRYPVSQVLHHRTDDVMGSYTNSLTHHVYQSATTSSMVTNDTNPASILHEESPWRPW